MEQTLGVIILVSIAFSELYSLGKKFYRYLQRYTCKCSYFTGFFIQVMNLKARIVCIQFYEHWNAVSKIFCQYVILKIFCFILKKNPSILFFLDIDIVPNSICYQEHDNLFLSCVFGDNNTIGAKFQFKPRDQPDNIYRINSTTVNFNTIEAQIPNITKSKDTGTYFCSKNGYNSRRIIYIEGSVSIFKHSI